MALLSDFPSFSWHELIKVVLKTAYRASVLDYRPSVTMVMFESGRGGALVGNSKPTMYILPFSQQGQSVGSIPVIR